MELIPLITQALRETLIMVGGSTLAGITLGSFLGTLLFKYHPKGLVPSPFVYLVLGFFINALRSLPYLILMVLMIPLTRLLTGTSIGTWGALVPLSLASILLFARVMEDALLSVPKGLLEIGKSQGATPFQIIRFIALPECLPGFINQTTLIVINLVGFSAMAGTVGGGGLGDLAIRYGYQRYDTVLMFIIVIILIVLVQSLQLLGDSLYKICNKK